MIAPPELFTPEFVADPHPTYAAANRDPGRFGEPDRLDLIRDGGQHLAFGHGRHRCVGAHLARAEGEIAIGVLLRLPELRPADPVEELEWLPFPVFRGVAKLPVRCG